MMAVLVACSFLLACGGSDSGGPSGLSGSMSFNFTGATNGSFSAQGTLNSTSFPTTTANWAAGFIDEADGFFVAEGLRAGSGGKFDVAFVLIRRTTVGSSTVDVGCTDEVCAEVFIDFGADQSGDFELSCFLEFASLTIATISDSRAAGTFTGGGTCFNSQFEDAGGITVTDGTFDVAIFSDIAAARAAP